MPKHKGGAPLLPFSDDYIWVKTRDRVRKVFMKLNTKEIGEEM